MRFRFPTGTFAALVVLGLPWLTWAAVIFGVAPDEGSRYVRTDDGHGMYVARPWMDTLSSLLLVEGLFALVAAVVLIVAALRVRRQADRPPGLWLAFLIVPFAFFTSFASCSIATGIARGRQLRERGRLRFAAVEEGDAWLDVDVALAAPIAAAAAWRENGLTEHASIAAFEKLARELTALGAPPALVDDARADADDERRHTRLCFSLAARMDGARRQPGELAPHRSLAMFLPRPLALAAIAADAFVQGLVLESASARTAAGLASVARDDDVARGLRGIAVDEVRHAEHGFDVVAWCLAEGGAAVRATLAATAERLATAPIPHADGSDELEVHGIASPARVDASYRRARAIALGRLSELLESVRTIDASVPGRSVHGASRRADASTPAA